MSIEENKVIARRWNDEIFDKGKLAAIDELVATDIVQYGPPPGVARGREAYKQANVTTMRTSFADIQCIIEDMVAEGDKVAVRWTWRGTHKGEFMGIAPTGKRVTLTGISILHIIGDKIVEEWDESDNLSMMQQLGAKIG